MKVLNVFLMVLFLTLTGCGDKILEDSEPERPATIPSSAIWVGGHDGGVFISITKPTDTDKEVYWGEIFYASGDIAYKGHMSLFPKENDGFDINNQSSYQGWDGDTLYIINNQSLKIVE